MIAMLRDTWWWPWWVSSVMDLAVVLVALVAFRLSKRRPLRAIAATFVVAGLVAAVLAPIVMTEHSDRADAGPAGDAGRARMTTHPARAGDIASDQPSETFDAVPTMSERWAGILLGQHPLALPYRAGRRLFGLLPSPWRCKFCNAPFRGPYAGTVKRIGYSPSRKNPQVCARCIEHAPEGGAIVPLAILFADVRGYTSLCEQLAASEVHGFLHRFYQTASAALLAQEGLLGQIAGDEVMALFVPGIAGRHYKRKAVEAARSLARVVRYTDSPAGGLAVGIGVASGEEFVGNVAGGGYKDFTAVGEVTNTAARLTSVAHDGEIVVDEATYAEVAQAYPDAGRQKRVLKGKRAPIDLFWIPP